jgi:hypothetical protein
VTFTARLLATPQAMSCTEPPADTFATSVQLVYLFDADGRPESWNIWFDSYLFTPAGLPIEQEADAEREIVVPGQAFPALPCVGEHAAEASLLVTFTVPADLPDGRYLPEVALRSQVPLDHNARFVAVWYHFGDVHPLPILEVGSAAPPHIP